MLYDAQGQPVQVVGARGGTNPLAIVSLVLSLVGFGLPAVITGVIARNQIRQHGGDGDGIARAGLVIGSLETVAAVILVVVAIA